MYRPPAFLIDRTAGGQNDDERDRTGAVDGLSDPARRGDPRSAAVADAMRRPLV